jgi:hypothetical protein
MTTVDKPAFAQAFSRLCVAHREKETDALTMRVYFEGLQDREIEFVVAAAERLLRASWFPKLGDWCQAAVTIEAERIAEQRALLRKLPTPLCPACGDSGWVEDANTPPPRRKKLLRPNPKDRTTPEFVGAPSNNASMVRCDCQRLRRLEVLGRQPWPTLPEGPRPDSDKPIGQADAVSLTKLIEQQTGRTITPRTMR